MSGEITGFPTLTARGLIVAAAVTFRERWRRVLAVGALVAAIAVVLDEALDRLVEAQHDNFPMWIAILLVGLAVLTSGANSFGSVFLSGLLDKTVGEHQHGHDHVRLSKLLVTLPFLTLIGADLVVTLMRGVGALFFIVPGIVVVTLTCVTGPVAIIEGRRALPAIGRSIRLTSGAFWLTFRAVTILMVAETLIDELLTSFAFAHNFFGHFGVAVVVEVPIALFVSLVEVTLAYQLIARDRARTRGALSEDR